MAITNLPFDERKKAKEDIVRAAHEKFDPAMAMISYLKLYNEGLRIEGIHHMIDKLIREELKRENQ